MFHRWPLALLCSSCALDWTVGSGSPDAGADVADDHTSIADGGPHVDGSDGKAPSEAASCGQLEANVDTAKLAAEKCSSMPDDCDSRVKDQCGCIVFVAQDSSEATATYSNAVEQLQDSGCPLGCGTCPKPPAQSLCLVNEQLGTSCTQAE
jgi:hypothetical protein